MGNRDCLMRIRIEPYNRFSASARRLFQELQRRTPSRNGRCTAPRAMFLDGALQGLAPRCVTIPNGVDVRRFRPPTPTERVDDGVRRIVFAGRISPEKGVHHLVEAFVRLARADASLRLELIGPLTSAPVEWVAGLSNDPATRGLLAYGGRPYAQRLLELIPAELRDRMSFEGPLDQDQLAGRLRRAHLFVHPSVWEEPFGMAVLEAMATGLPTIATWGGGIPEFLTDGADGLLVERGSTDALCAAMQALLDDPERAAGLGRRARETACERFTWDHTVTAMRTRLFPRERAARELVPG